MRKLYAGRQATDPYDPWLKTLPGRDVAAIGPEALIGRTLLERALGVAKVSELEAELSESGQLFRAQFTTNLQFRLDSHSQLSCLSCGKLVYSLLDQRLIDRFCVQRLIQRDVCLAHSASNQLALDFILLEDHSNLLALFRCQVELFDLIYSRRRWILGISRTGSRKE